MSDIQLVARELTCPACESSFVLHTPKSRAYQLARRDADFCPHYEGLNPLFYQVWVCPRCSFAAYKEHWGPLSEVERVGMRQLSSESTEGLRFDFSQPERTLFAAILSYKLAYRFYLRRMPTSYDHLGGVQMRLAWLCRIGNDRKREIQHLGAAIVHFAEAFDHGRKLSMSEGKIAYLLGELNRRIGNGEGAVDWYMRAIKMDPAKGEVYRMSRDQLYEAKESIRFFQHLQMVEFLKPLPIEHVAELAAQVKSHRVVPGGKICSKGEQATSMFIIVKGAVRIHPGDVSEPQLATLTVGQYFGEACLLTGQLRNATAIADQAAEVLEIDRVAFKTVLASNSEIAAELRRMLSFRAEQMERWRGEVTGGKTEPKGPDGFMMRLLNYFDVR